MSAVTATAEAFIWFASEATREFIRSRRDTSVPPGEQVADFEEYTRLYRETMARLGASEYYNFDVSPTSARDRFAEALSLVRRAWSEPEPLRR